MVTMASSATSSIGVTPLSPDVTTTTVQKKSSENRRSNKPIMEKRRRARINNSLNELKALILDAMKKDPARHSKLEKADILEMTVKHLESLHKQQAAMSAVTDPQVVNKYRAGFNECAGEVGRFPGLEPMVRRRLLQHLSTCLNATAIAASTAGSIGGGIDASATKAHQQNLQVHILPSETGAKQHHQNGIFLSAGSNAGVQLVPTRLPNGDLALILPSASTTSSHIQQRLSVSPAPSGSSSSSPPPLAMINHSRSASTDSAASSNSPIGFERLSVTIPKSSPNDDCHSPSSINSAYSSPNSPASQMKYEHYGLYSPPLQKPLSLVVRESYGDREPWRPW
ncbi:protein hairy-like [Planococcus citri]|uniref:protein hairy-like n=1 Tax=Planococcus citri TaxID=170843 RepID=UPI0031F73E42